MSSNSSSAIRGMEKNIFYAPPCGGKQHEPKRQPRQSRYPWKWPEQDTIYRKRMAVANAGSKYDCRSEYPSTHCLMRATATATATASTAPKSESSSGKSSESSYDAAKMQWERTDDPREDEREMQVPEWLLWVKYNLLQPIHDAIISLPETRFSLQARLKEAEQAYSAAQHEAGQHLEKRLAARAGPQRQRPDYLKASMGILSKTAILLYVFLFAQFVDKVKAAGAVNTTLPSPPPAHDGTPMPCTIPQMLPWPWGHASSFGQSICSTTPMTTLVSNMAHLTRPFRALATDMYITMHTSPTFVHAYINTTALLLTCLLLAVTGPLVLQTIYLVLHVGVAVLVGLEGFLPEGLDGLFTVHPLLALRWLHWQALRALLHVAEFLALVPSRVLRAACAVSWEHAGWPAVAFYVSRAWNSVIVHRAGGTMGRLATSVRFWAFVVVGVAMANWGWVLWEGWVDVRVVRGAAGSERERVIFVSVS